MKRQIQLGSGTCLASWNAIHILLKQYRFRLYQYKGEFYLTVDWAPVSLLTNCKSIWDRQ